MGLMFRVRVSSFFAGAAAASIAGFLFFYKDYKLAQDAIFRQVKDTHLSLEERYEHVDKRLTALEEQKEAETATTVATS